MIEKIVEKGIKEYKDNRQGRAIELFLKALKKSQGSRQKSLIFYNLGLCYYAQKNYEKSARHFKKSADLGFYKSNWELSLSRLHLGDLGGLDLFSWRPDKKSPNLESLGMREIRSLSDIKKAKKVLVFNEQGFGDEILFSRGFHLLEGVGHSYQVYPETLNLFKELFPSGNFFSERTISIETLKEHDYWVYSGDLFVLYTKEFGTCLNKPLRSENTSREEKVGVCFSTNRLSPNSDKRSLNKEEFKKVMTEKNLCMVSLQKGETLDFAESLELKDFKETFEIISRLNSVVTVDTSVAHASALSGTRTFLVYKDYLDWRWKHQFYGENVSIVSFSDLENLRIL